ncbi:hypothetical protein FB451DRAFT_1476595 [Mycena latifolia]|nr:hypothetical protein FB451DRAFT_1476595 [Mycena latifolia]
MPDLPSEVWTQVFDLAADEDLIFEYGLPTTMSESEWFEDYFGDWALRSPQDVLDLAIVQTCKQWRNLGYESLFRFLFFSDPARLLTLCGILDPSSAAATTATASLGWWTRRIQVTRFYANTTREASQAALQDALVRILCHCPNLEIFIVDWPMAGSTFSPIADALTRFTSNSLRTLHITVPALSLPKVIWTLNALPYVCAAHIELSSEVSPPGPQNGPRLRLPHLQQLSLGGYTHQLLKQATRWQLPALRHFSLVCDTPKFGPPDTPAFIAAHGAHLISLDLSSGTAMPLSRLIAACPALTSLAFHGDWRVVVPDDPDAPAETPPLAHTGLTSVGLHGLAYAFGVGAALDAPPTAQHNTYMNDRNLALLCERARFPALRRIRVLSRGLLGELDRARGPGAEGGGAARWARWWKMCREAGIQLEDCTGGLLGELPRDYDGGYSHELEEVEEEHGEWDIEIPPIAPKATMVPGRGTSLDELRRLLRSVA